MDGIATTKINERMGHDIAANYFVSFLRVVGLITTEEGQAIDQDFPILLTFIRTAIKRDMLKSAHHFG